MWHDHSTGTSETPTSWGKQQAMESMKEFIISENFLWHATVSQLTNGRGLKNLSYLIHPLIG